MLRNRHEATSIPNLLVAPRDPADGYSQQYDAYDADVNGYYEDGAYYTSDPVPAALNTAEGDEQVEMDPRLVYFDSILSRFETLRSQLQRKPPPEEIATLGSTYPLVPPPNTKQRDSAAKWWRDQMYARNPAPVQIANMDKNNVLRALRSLNTGGKLLRSGKDIKPSVSLWIWALLARLPERGELTSEEIGVVRELGKRAVLVSVGLGKKDDWQEGMNEVETTLDEEDEEGDEAYIANDAEVQSDVNENFDAGADEGMGNTDSVTSQIAPQMPRHQDQAEGGETSGTRSERATAPSTQNNQGDEPQLESEEEFNAAKARMLARLESQAMEYEVNIEPEVEAPQETTECSQGTRSNTTLTVDMILTVAGEMYGQRDLLEFRPQWIEDSAERR